MLVELNDADGKNIFLDPERIEYAFSCEKIGCKNLRVGLQSGETIYLNINEDNFKDKLSNFIRSDKQRKSEKSRQLENEIQDKLLFRRIRSYIYEMVSRILKLSPESVHKCHATTMYTKQGTEVPLYVVEALYDVAEDPLVKDMNDTLRGISDMNLGSVFVDVLKELCPEYTFPRGNYASYYRRRVNEADIESGFSWYMYLSDED